MISKNHHSHNDILYDINGWGWRGCLLSATTLRSAQVGRVFNPSLAPASGHVSLDPHICIFIGPQCESRSILSGNSCFLGIHISFTNFIVTKNISKRNFLVDTYLWLSMQSVLMCLHVYNKSCNTWAFQVTNGEQVGGARVADQSVSVFPKTSSGGHSGVAFVNI